MATAMCLSELRAKPRVRRTFDMAPSAPIRKSAVMRRRCREGMSPDDNSSDHRSSFRSALSNRYPVKSTAPRSSAGGRSNHYLFDQWMRGESMFEINLPHDIDCAHRDGIAACLVSRKLRFID